MKKVYLGLTILALSVAAVVALPANTNIAVWRTNSFVNSRGDIVAPNFIGGIDGASLKAGSVDSAALSSTIITNVLAAGMVLPAVDGSAVTNMNASELKSGNAPVAVISNAISSLDGNKPIPVAAISNALWTAGPKVGGNIPVAAISNAISVLDGNKPIPQAALTNALLTAGSKIGGNIPKTSLTNAYNGYSFIQTNAHLAFSNLYYFVDGVCTGMLSY